MKSFLALNKTQAAFGTVNNHHKHGSKTESMSMKRLRIACLLLLSFFLLGCNRSQEKLAAKQPITASDKTAKEDRLVVAKQSPIAREAKIPTLSERMASALGQFDPGNGDCCQEINRLADEDMNLVTNELVRGLAARDSKQRTRALEAINRLISDSEERHDSKSQNQLVSYLAAHVQHSSDEETIVAVLEVFWRWGARMSAVSGVVQFYCQHSSANVRQAAFKAAFAINVDIPHRIELLGKVLADESAIVRKVADVPAGTLIQEINSWADTYQSPDRHLIGNSSEDAGNLHRKLLKKHLPTIERGLLHPDSVFTTARLLYAVGHFDTDSVMAKLTSDDIADRKIGANLICAAAVFHSSSLLSHLGDLQSPNAKEIADALANLREHFASFDKPLSALMKSDEGEVRALALLPFVMFTSTSRELINASTFAASQSASLQERQAALKAIHWLELRSQELCERIIQWLKTEPDNDIRTDLGNILAGHLENSPPELLGKIAAVAFYNEQIAAPFFYMLWNHAQSEDEINALARGIELQFDEHILFLRYTSELEKWAEEDAEHARKQEEAKAQQAKYAQMQESSAKDEKEDRYPRVQLKSMIETEFGKSSSLSGEIDRILLSETRDDDLRRSTRISTLRSDAVSSRFELMNCTNLISDTGDYDEFGPAQSLAFDRAFMIHYWKKSSPISRQCTHDIFYGVWRKDPMDVRSAIEGYALSQRPPKKDEVFEGLLKFVGTSKDWKMVTTFADGQTETISSVAGNLKTEKSSWEFPTLKKPIQSETSIKVEWGNGEFKVFSP